ncbi:MAG: DegT/DnrJ/EryC1/StrS family aminotransferase [Desulfurivibrionaceae bacterium]
MQLKKDIAFIDLKAQQATIRPQIERNIQKVLNHGRYILGPEVQEFEEKLADFCGVKHCIGVSSCTDALLMVLMARGIGPGDAVFTTPFTFIATAEIISLLGATPVFVDIDPGTYNLDPAQLKKAIKAAKEDDASIHPLPTHQFQLNPKAIIPVDLFGLPADYDAIMETAAGHGLFVLEDAAQSVGATYKGRKTGSLGHAAAASFFPAKPLGCYGDGGAVLTDDDSLAREIESIRVHGKGKDKYDNIRTGLNARLHTMQAAILLAKLDIFEKELTTKQQIAERYSQGIQDISNRLTTPHIPEGLQSAWAQYSLVTEDRGCFQESLKKAGVPTMVYYPKPLHLQTAFQPLGYSKGDMPVSEKISETIFSLPMHAYLSEEEIDFIVGRIGETSV